MVIIITILTSATAYARSSTPKITINKKQVKYDVKPYMDGNEAMLPVKQTAEALGAKVEYDKKSNIVWVSMSMTRVELPIGKSELYIHRDADFTGIPQTVKLSTEIISVKGVTFVTGKKFVESLGMTATWDSKKKFLSIIKDKSVDIDLSKDIPYSVIRKEDISDITVSNWYDANYKKSGINFMKHDGVMYVLIGAGKKPTGGYTMGINKISYDTATKAYVYAYVKNPSPDMMVTQAETFPNMLIKIESNNILNTIAGNIEESIEEIVSNKVAYDEITFDYFKYNETLKNWYNENNQKQGISSIRVGKYMYVLIGAGQKPTGGYTISIDDVTLSSNDTVSINARVCPPGDNVRVIMMITYPSKLIRIESDTIKNVIGDIVDTTNTTGKEKWVTMDAATVASMELLDLDQVKIRDITGTEKNDIMKSFNEATIDQNSYIFMLTGNILKVYTIDGYILTFTSYGSETNVIVNIEKDHETRTFHLVAPVIAKVLLNK
jgi:hypothetical protein